MKKWLGGKVGSEHPLEPNGRFYFILFCFVFSYYVLFCLNVGFVSFLFCMFVCFAWVLKC